MPNHPPLGFTFAGIAAGIKKTGAADLALIASDRPCAAAAVFTRNAFPAAPVQALAQPALIATPRSPAGFSATRSRPGCRPARPR